MWTLKEEERLHEWKEFRQTISNLPFEEAILKTVNLWSFAPFVNHYLDRCEPTEWPTPWELLQDNKYDDMAKALAMLYTLFLSTHGKEHSFTIERFVSGSQLESYNVVSIDSGTYILNYNFNEVIPWNQIDPDLKLVSSITPTDLQLDKY